MLHALIQRQRVIITNTLKKMFEDYKNQLIRKTA